MRDIDGMKNVHELAVGHGNAVDRVRWRLFLRSNQRKMAGFLDETMQIILDFTRMVKSGQCDDIEGLLKEFDERTGVILSVLRSKSLQVEMDYFSGKGETGGDKKERIGNWGARAVERVCFNVLLAELE